MKKLTLIIIGALALASCRKQPNLNELSYNPIVATPHYDGADWTQYKTYYIPDTIAKVDGDHPMDSVWTDANAQKLIAQIKKNMNARGFTLVPLSANPDIVIPSIAIKIETDVYGGGYYWGYPGYWDPYYWGGGYYYYPYYYTYSYTSGAFVFEMADHKNVNANNGKLVLLWTGFLGGYMSDYSSTNINAAVNGIDQAFAQSTYIKAGN